MGIPFDKIICASNDNKVLHDFFTNGIYDLRDRYLHKTISPAIGNNKYTENLKKSRPKNS